MTLNQIFEQTSQIFDKSPVTREDREYLLYYINLAAREFWDTQDLPEAIREKSFSADNRVVTLPDYVGQLRAIRECCDKSTIVSKVARYQTGAWTRNQCNQFTELGTRATAISAKDFSTITVEMAAVDDCQASVVISGPTASARLAHYTFSIQAGVQLSTLSTNLVDISTIVKKLPTNMDILVRDGAGTEIARLPNTSMRSLYKLVHVGPRYCHADCMSTSTNCEQPQLACPASFDVLYKLPFSPLVNDDDVFPIYGYETQFFYKLIEIRKLTSEEQTVETIVQKENALRKYIDTDQRQAHEMKVDMGRNPYKYIKYRTSRRNNTTQYIAGEDNFNL